MKILYFGSYKPSYPRNKIIIDGLLQNGVEVVECNDRTPSFLRFFKVAWKYLHLKKDFDAVIVGFPGQEMMFLAKILSRKPIIFDVFTSHYMGYILDRKYFSQGSLRAKYYRFLDRWSCMLADVVFLDTQAHIDFFVREFNLDSKKFKRVWLGANPQLHKPRDASRHSGLFSVLFWGNFIPLQGIETIIRAANLLRHEPIRFTLIGQGQTQEANKKLAQELQLTNVLFLGRLPDESLVEHIASTDVCLGVFSSGEKADITIQNKIFESLASRKPMVTIETTALHELLDDGEGVVFCKKADPKDLAEKILELKNNPELRDRIARKGYTLFIEKLTPEKVVRDLIVKCNLMFSK